MVPFVAVELKRIFETAGSSAKSPSIRLLPDLFS
jgi:hypothetical protein